MARSLTIHFTDGGHQASFDCALHKVDRSKLYGARKIETLDEQGDPCELATLLDDGKTLIPYGGTASGYLNPDGEWVSRGQITPVDPDGEPLQKVSSSFDTGLTLSTRASMDEFLDHSIRLSYALQSEALDPVFVETLADGAIFKTRFSYRGGIHPDPAFVLQGEDQTIWLLIARENVIEYAALEQAAVIAATEEDDDETDSDELDFGLL